MNQEATTQTEETTLNFNLGASGEIPVTPGEDEEMSSIAKRAGEIDPPKTDSPVRRAQAAYIEFERQFREIAKPILDGRKEALQNLVDLCGVGHHFQDHSGTVYQIASKVGQWVDFTPFEIKRTRKEGETRGSLSLSDAKALGYEVDKQAA